MIDKHFTPSWMADQLVSLMPEDLDGPVLDPSVGGGALLEAVERRYGRSIPLLGIDVDPRAVRMLRATKPEWVLSEADSLLRRSRASSTVWRLASGGLDAVVLNPPFSQRGAGGRHLRYREFEGRVGPSLEFLVTITRALMPRLGAFAIMPLGAMEALRYRSLWQQLHRDFDIDVRPNGGTSSFKGVRVATVLVRMVPHLDPARRAASPRSSFKSSEPTRDGLSHVACRCVDVIRGRVPVHTVGQHASAEGVPFVHSTNLRGRPTQAWVQRRLADESPMLLIPRVGRWLTPTSATVGDLVLSDCVIGLRPRQVRELPRLQESVASSAVTFAEAYTGTGAKYITVHSVESVLRGLGWRPHPVRAGTSIGRCECRETTP